MAEDEGQRGRGPRGGVALGFAISALAACWNPLAAPLGLLVGVAAAVLGARALRGAAGPRRRVPAVALALGILAALASVLVLVLTAGAVGVEIPGEPIVKERSPAELEEVLSQAGERTLPQRERARKELDRLGGDAGRGKNLPGRDGGTGSPGPRGGDAP